MNARCTWYTVPVVAVFLPATRLWSYINTIRSCRHIQTTIAQIATIEIFSCIVFATPQITTHTTNNSRPIVSSLYRNTCIAQAEITLWVSFRLDALQVKLAIDLLFLAVCCILCQSHIDRSHCFIEFIVTIRCSGPCHKSIMDRRQTTFPVGMTARH